MTYQHIYVIPDQGNLKGGDLYDKFGNLAFFADVTALVDKTQTGYDLVVPVKASTRGRFMRDPAPYTVAANTRYVSMNIRQTKGGIPGVTITLVSPGIGGGIERRQFGYTGSLSGLYAWLKTTANITINMFGPTGTPYDPIAAAP
jgi:hypothetical protein|tara:strand:- start:1728 stop:2162 length:435 start_codon:yes stop_codon:yes gene_type:complete